MSKKIKVCHHAKTIGYSGTDRTAQLFCKYLSYGDLFEPYIVYRKGDPANSRLDTVRSWLGDDRVIGYDWTPGHSGATSPFVPEQETLSNVLEEIDPDIVHVHRSGYTEWPCMKYMAPRAKWIETNIFGEADRQAGAQPDLNVYISQYIRDRAVSKGNPDGPILFNPIEQPIMDMTPECKKICRREILQAFDIPDNAVLIGRVGRADNFDPISLMAFSEVEKICPEAWYVVINPCDRWRQEALRLNISNIKFGGPIVDDLNLSNFYRGLDVYAHARHDGECCPCNIQEAMMHGLPIVSHESMIYNGQSEIIADAGFVVPVGNWEAYRDVLIELVRNQTMVNEEETGFIGLRDHFGIEARRRAMRHFEASCVTSQLSQIYEWVLKNE